MARTEKAGIAEGSEIMTGHTRRTFMKGTAAAAAGALTSQAHGQSERPPNLLLIVTDDHRADALGCAGNPIIQTPHMDALANDGCHFVNAFVTTPICATSRASIFTGMYARSHGIHGFHQNLEGELLENSYFVQLQKAGYRTGFVGKFGVGQDHPKEAFDYFVGGGNGTPYWIEENGRTRHLTGYWSDFACDFLRETPADQPFCLSVSYRAPHTDDYAARPYPADPAYDELYADIEFPLPELAKEQYYQALPEFLQNSEGRKRWENRFKTPGRFQESMRDMYRMITGVDANIGRMRHILAERGLDDNTVIIVAGDNGAFIGERGLAGKWYGHEESIRSPIIIYDPRAPEADRGARPEEMALNIDIAPTLLDAAGVAPPSVMQGESLMPLVRGEAPDWRKHWFFEHLFEHERIPRSEGVRHERFSYWRWIDGEPGMEELYDLKRDPRQTENLAEDPVAADTLTRLRGLCDTYAERLAAAAVR